MDEKLEELITAVEGAVNSQPLRQTEPANYTRNQTLDVALKVLKLFELIPIKIVKSAPGGFAIVYVSDKDKYADIECLNDGSITGCITNRKDFVKSWEITNVSKEGLVETASLIKEFVS